MGLGHLFAKRIRSLGFNLLKGLPRLIFPPRYLLCFDIFALEKPHWRIKTFQTNLDVSLIIQVPNEKSFT
jgi:hypothetical protein